MKRKALQGAATFCSLALLVTVSLLSLPATALAAPGEILLCSTDAGGVQGNDDSYSIDITSDGRFVVFESFATNLVPGDTNAKQDIFWKDLQTGDIVRCSTDAGGTQADDFSSEPVISAGERYVAFVSRATNLGCGGTNGFDDIFRKDLYTGAIVCCSTDDMDCPSNGPSYGPPAISADGRYVTFLSQATNLVDGDINGKSDIFRKDLQTGEIALCSTNAAGVQANDHSERPSMSDDGRYVAFGSPATNLVTPDTNGWYDNFRKDMVTGAVVLCSPGIGGEANDDSYPQTISADGRYVAYLSYATNLVDGDTNGKSDIFRYDALTGSVERCSITAAGVQGNDDCERPCISGDGRFVVFPSEASNLVSGDTNAKSDVFRKDMQTGAIECASTNAAGQIRQGWSDVPAVNADGRYVVFSSDAPDLVPGYTAGHGDVYRKELAVTHSFYFAEGYTGNGFQEYLCLGNPGDTGTFATITYLFPDGTTQEQEVELAANSRLTVNVNGVVGEGREVSAVVGCDNPIVAERPMYFDYQDAWTGGHDVVGASSPAGTWYFAEGYTGAGFDEWICVLNPGDAAADLTFRFQTQEEGEKVVAGFGVPAHSRGSFKANDLLGGGSFQTSLTLESNRPVVAERSMYFSYSGTGGWGWTGGHCVMGASELAKEYYFAEGTTRGGFEEWITIQNPGLNTIEVEATYMLGTGETREFIYPVPAAKRSTVYVPGEVGTDQDVSVQLSCASPFLAERPMYFNYQGLGAWGWTGGHCVIGATESAQGWFFAEGYTGSGFEEWLCIQNPGDSRVEVSITYYPEVGAPIEKDSFTVAANSRFTVPVNADAGPDLAISAEVTADQAIIVERPMYFSYGPGWTGGHDVLGFIP